MLLQIPWTVACEGPADRMSRLPSPDLTNFLKTYQIRLKAKKINLASYISESFNYCKHKTSVGEFQLRSWGCVNHRTTHFMRLFVYFLHIEITGTDKANFGNKSILTYERCKELFSVLTPQLVNLEGFVLHMLFAAQSQSRSSPRKIVLCLTYTIACFLWVICTVQQLTNRHVQQLHVENFSLVKNMESNQNFL